MQKKAHIDIWRAVMSGRTSDVKVLCSSGKQGDGVPQDGMLRGNTPGFICNVLIQMVRSDLSVHK